VLDLAEDRAGVGEQRAAGLGQRDAARQPAEQLDVELALERADLLAERRLLDAEPLGRAGDVALLGDRQAIAQVAQLPIQNISKSRLRYYGSNTGTALLVARSRGESAMIDLSADAVARLYETMEQRLAVARRRLDRPLTLAEKVLFGHLDAPET